MTFMEKSLANELNLVLEVKEMIEISCLEETTTKRQTSIVNCKIQGRDSDCQGQDLKKV